jgi:tetratricopeptide (TPR) repeat protein
VTQDVDLADLERYLRIYQENPDSRVFAPLADMYRRLARFREAEQVSREGLLRHPYYAGGKVALAHVLLDTERLQEALDIIEEVVTFYPDNLLARRILIKTLAGLNYWERAEREYSAYRVIAPGMAEDPELARLFQNDRRAPVRQASAVPTSSLREPIPARARNSQPTSATLTPTRMSPEKRRLFLKKKILETWLKSLESGAL